MKNRTKPLISVIINCFNGQKFLKKTLSSLRKQTYKNWELIFWDNHSTDNSKKIFKTFKDKRFKYFKSKSHSALYDARNKAVKKSKGEFLCFLDCDDWWVSTKLEEQIKLFNKKNVGLVYSKLFIFSEKNKKKKVFKKIAHSGFITEKILQDHSIGFVTALIRKKSYLSVKGFNSKYNISGDFDFILKISLRWKILCCDKILAYYRIHQNNLSKKMRSAEIKELENILKSGILVKTRFKKLLRNFINYKKILLQIDEGKFFLALKNILIYPLTIKKIKLFATLCLPSFIQNSIKFS